MSDAEAELIGVVHAWDRAMIANDVDDIGQYMSYDWTIIGPDGTVSDKASFLRLVKSGVLIHDVMDSHDLSVRLYGDAAVVIARGISGGKYEGREFYLVERTSCVIVRQEGDWKCVATHLSQLAEPSQK